MDFHATLMRHAVDPGDPTALALAGVLSSAFDQEGVRVLPIRGLDVCETRWLFSRWFPGADVALSFAWGDWPSRRGSRYDEVEDLVTLFKNHADPGVGTPGEAGCVAHALACACLGANHLIV